MRTIRHRTFTERQDFAGLHLTTEGAHGSAPEQGTTFTLDMLDSLDGLATVCVVTGGKSHGQILDRGQLEAMRDGITTLLAQFDGVTA